MWELQRRKKIQAIMYSKMTLCILIIVAILVIRGTINIYQKSVESEKAMVKSEEQVAALEARNKVLTDTNNRLQTPEGIEREIRQKYSVVKNNGEQMFVIVDPKEVPVDKTSKPTFWSRIQAFFGKNQ